MTVTHIFQQSSQRVRMADAGVHPNKLSECPVVSDVAVLLRGPAFLSWRRALASPRRPRQTGQGNTLLAIDTPIC
jgi:hypothetical protein